MEEEIKKRNIQKIGWYIFAFIIILSIIVKRSPPLSNELKAEWWSQLALVLMEASFVFYLLISGFSFVISGLLRDEKIEFKQKVGLLIGFILYSILTYILIHSFESGDFNVNFLSYVLGSIGWFVVLIDFLLGLEKKIIKAGIKYSTITFTLGIILPLILSIFNKGIVNNDFFIAFQGGIIATALIIVNVDFDPLIYKDTFKASLK